MVPPWRNKERAWRSPTRPLSLLPRFQNHHFTPTLSLRGLLHTDASTHARAYLNVQMRAWILHAWTPVASGYKDMPKCGRLRRSETSSPLTAQDWIPTSLPPRRQAPSPLPINEPPPSSFPGAHTLQARHPHTSVFYLLFVCIYVYTYDTQIQKWIQISFCMWICLILRNLNFRVFVRCRLRRCRSLCPCLRRHLFGSSRDSFSRFP